MADKAMSKTQARTAERERRQARAARNEKLKGAIPFVSAALFLVLAAGYLIYPRINTPPRPEITGIEGPRLEVDRDRIDLGPQRFNQPVRAAFNVKNAGDGTLKLNAPQLVTALQGC